MQIRAVIDRFESNRAILWIGEEERQVTWFRQDLPPAAAEGDILCIEISLDRQATRQAATEAADLLRRLVDKNQP